MKFVYVKTDKENREAYTQLMDLLKSVNLEENYNWFWEQLRKNDVLVYTESLMISKVKVSEIITEDYIMLNGHKIKLHHGKRSRTKKE